MRDLGYVLQTYSAHKGCESKQRPRVDALTMISGHGIKNDKFAGKNENRAVMLIGQKAYKMTKEAGIVIEEGNLGENILVDFDPHQFGVGDVFVIGDVELEITEKCTICKSLCAYDKALPKLLSQDRGLYCKITKDGMMKPNDHVRLKD